MDYEPSSWRIVVASRADAEIYHYPEWLDFLTATQAVEPVVARVVIDGRHVGYFTGGLVRRFGVRILGSPLRGWTTMHMGFLLDEELDRRVVASALEHFAFQDLRAAHVELSDRWTRSEAMRDTGWHVEPRHTYVVDLAPAEDEILAHMRATTRNYIRRASRRGLTLDTSSGSDFVADYYRLLTDVFTRQGLAPTYSLTRVRQLVEVLRPEGRVLCLRMRDSSGSPIAASITVGAGDTAVLWGAAFDRTRADAHPNEALHWEAMRYWKAHGATRFDFGGAGDYKLKYGGVEEAAFVFHKSRNSVLRIARSGVRSAVRARQVLIGRRARGQVRPSTAEVDEGGSA